MTAPEEQPAGGAVLQAVPVEAGPTVPVGRVAVVTGGNKGLGKETVQRLLTAGWTVYLAARDAERGRLAASETGARPLALDVTDGDSVVAAAEVVRDQVGHLDLLVNNAGVVGEVDTPTAMVSAEEVGAVHDTNVLGLVRVTRAFLPLLQAAPAPAIINVSSGMGSLARVSDPGSIESGWPSLAYGSSKAAVNMLTLQYAKAFPGIRVNAVDPGLTATDATGGMGRAVAEGVVATMALVLAGDSAPTGTFTDAEGAVPW